MSSPHDYPDDVELGLGASVYPWRQNNTEGYTDAQLAALNSEFRARWIAGDWSGATVDEAASWFADEVAGR